MEYGRAVFSDDFFTSLAALCINEMQQVSPLAIWIRCIERLGPATANAFFPRRSTC